MFCQKCGAELPEGAIFCAKCGERTPEMSKSNPNIEAGNTNSGGLIKYFVIGGAVIVGVALALAVTISHNNTKKGYSELDEKKSAESKIEINNSNTNIKDITSTVTDKSKNDKKENEADSINNEGVIELCARSDEWNELTIEDMAIQVGDIVLYPGCSLEEAMGKIEKSDYYMGSNYNPSRLETSGTSVEVSIVMNKGYVIEMEPGVYLPDLKVCAYNYTEDTTELKNLIVTSISIESEAIYPYCRFIDGRSYDDIMAMNYHDVKDMKCMSNLDMDEGMNIQIVYEASSLHPFSVQRSQWTHYDFTGTTRYAFEIDPDTMSVTRFSTNSSISMSHRSTGDPITSFDDISEENMHELINDAKEMFVKEIGKDSTLDDIFDTAYYIHTENTDKIVILMNYTDNTGNSKVACAEIYNPGILYDGAMGYKFISVTSSSDIEHASSDWKWAIADERKIDEIEK